MRAVQTEIKSWLLIKPSGILELRLRSAEIPLSEEMAFQWNTFELKFHQLLELNIFVLLPAFSMTKPSIREVVLWKVCSTLKGNFFCKIMKSFSTKRTFFSKEWKKEGYYPVIHQHQSRVSDENARWCMNLKTSDKFYDCYFSLSGRLLCRALFPRIAQNVLTNILFYCWEITSLGLEKDCWRKRITRQIQDSENPHDLETFLGRKWKFAFWIIPMLDDVISYALDFNF